MSTTIPPLLRSKPKQSRVAVFALGFRPFFLAAGLAAIALMGLWLAEWTGLIAPQARFLPPSVWHAHEMLFGYTAAVIAGFLLTAVRNWTGIQTPTGPALAALATLWLVGRVSMLFPEFPAALAAALNVAFFPLLALSIGKPIWQGKNRTNRWFLAILIAMAVAQCLVHLEAIDGLPTARAGLRLMLDLVVLLLILVGGRVLPFFTERAVAQAKPRNRRPVETASYVLAIALIAADLVIPHSPATATVSAALAVTQAARLAGWHDPRVWRTPILWVLYTGYLWMVLGLVIKGLSGWGLVPASFAVHALTTGMIGVFTLGMMSRVTLGHTGRAIGASKAMILAFVLINLAALGRGIGPLLFPSAYLYWISVSGGFWMLAFVLFVTAHGAMLWKPRVDGAPG